MNTDPLVSVVVPVRDDERGLGILLGALAQQVGAPPFEVIVVDNGSTPPVRVGIDGLDVRVVREERPGSYRARQSGVEAARGAMLAFTDADCRPDAAWLRTGSVRLGAAGRGIVAGRIRVVMDRGRRTLAADYERVFAFDQRRYVEAGGYGATANLFVSRLVHDELGGFDTRLFSSGDLEFGRRAGRADVPISYAHDVVVDHPARTRLRDLVRKHRRVAGGQRQVAASSGARRPSPGGRPLITPLRQVVDARRAGRCEGPAHTLRLAFVAVLLDTVRRLESGRIRAGGQPVR